MEILFQNFILEHLFFFKTFVLFSFIPIIFSFIAFLFSVSFSSVSGSVFRICVQRYLFFTSYFVISAHGEHFYTALHNGPFPPFVILFSSLTSFRVLRMSQFRAFPHLDLFTTSDSPFAVLDPAKEVQITLPSALFSRNLEFYSLPLVIQPFQGKSYYVFKCPITLPGLSGTLIFQDGSPVGIYANHILIEGSYFTIVQPVFASSITEVTTLATMPIDNLYIPTTPHRLEAHTASGKTRRILHLFATSTGRFLFVVPSVALARDLFYYVTTDPTSALYPYASLIGISVYGLVVNVTAKVLIVTSYSVVRSLTLDTSYLTNFTAFALDEYDFDYPYTYILYRFALITELPCIFISATTLGAAYPTSPFPPAGFARNEITAVPFSSSSVLVALTTRYTFKTMLVIGPTIAKMKNLMASFSTTYPTARVFILTSSTDQGALMTSYKQFLGSPEKIFIFATSSARAGLSLPKLDAAVELGTKFVPTSKTHCFPYISQSEFIQSYGRPVREKNFTGLYFYSQSAATHALPYSHPSDSLSLSFLLHRFGIVAPKEFTDPYPNFVALAPHFVLPEDGTKATMALLCLYAQSSQAHSYAASNGISFDLPLQSPSFYNSVQTVNSRLLIQMPDSTYVQLITTAATHLTFEFFFFLNFLSLFVIIPFRFFIGYGVAYNYNPLLRTSITFFNPHVPIVLFQVILVFLSFFFPLTYSEFARSLSIFVFTLYAFNLLLLLGFYTLAEEAYRLSGTIRPGHISSSALRYNPIGSVLLFACVGPALSLPIASTAIMSTSFSDFIAANYAALLHFLSFVLAFFSFFSFLSASAELFDLILRVMRDVAVFTREIKDSTFTYAASRMLASLNPLFFLLSAPADLTTSTVTSYPANSSSYGSFLLPFLPWLFLFPFSLPLKKVKFKPAETSLPESYVAWTRVCTAALSFAVLLSGNVFLSLAVLLIGLHSYFSPSLVFPLFLVFVLVFLLI